MIFVFVILNLGHLISSVNALYTVVCKMSQCDFQSINHLFAHNTSSNEAVWTSRRDEQDRQATGALTKHPTKIYNKTVVKRVQMSEMKAIKWL